MDLEAKQNPVYINEVKGHEITTLLASKQYHMSCPMTIMGLFSFAACQPFILTVSIFVCQ